MEARNESPRRGRAAASIAAAAVSAFLLAAAGLRPSFADLPDIVPFLGRFHPLAVHLPIGFLIALVLLEWLDLRRPSASLQRGTRSLAWLAAVSAVFSAVFGILLACSGDYAPDLLGRHLWLGTVTAVLAVWLPVLKPRANACSNGSS